MNRFPLFLHFSSISVLIQPSQNDTIKNVTENCISKGFWYLISTSSTKHQSILQHLLNRLTITIPSHSNHNHTALWHYLQKLEFSLYRGKKINIYIRGLLNVALWQIWVDRPIFSIELHFCS